MDSTGTGKLTVPTSKDREPIGLLYAFGVVHDNTEDRVPPKPPIIAATSANSDETDVTELLPEVTELRADPIFCHQSSVKVWDRSSEFRLNSTTSVMDGRNETALPFLPPKLEIVVIVSEWLLVGLLSGISASATNVTVFTRARVGLSGRVAGEEESISCGRAVVVLATTGATAYVTCGAAVDWLASMMGRGGDGKFLVGSGAATAATAGTSGSIMRAGLGDLAKLGTDTLEPGEETRTPSFGEVYATLAPELGLRTLESGEERTLAKMGMLAAVLEASGVRSLALPTPALARGSVPVLGDKAIVVGGDCGRAVLGDESAFGGCAVLGEEATIVRLACGCLIRSATKAEASNTATGEFPIRREEFGDVDLADTTAGGTVRAIT